jgi:hypothetical protein
MGNTAEPAAALGSALHKLCKSDAAGDKLLGRSRNRMCKEDHLYLSRDLRHSPNKGQLPIGQSGVNKSRPFRRGIGVRRTAHAEAHIK